MLNNFSVVVKAEKIHCYILLVNWPSWCVCKAINFPSAIARINAMLFSGYSAFIFSKYTAKVSGRSPTSGLC